MKKLVIIANIIPLWLILATSAIGQPLVKELKFQTTTDALRLVFGLTEPIQPEISYLSDPYRITIDLQNTRFEAKLPKIPTTGSFIQNIRNGYQEDNRLRIVLECDRPTEARDFWLTSDQRFGHKLILDMKANRHKIFASRLARQPTTTRVASANFAYHPKTVRPDLRVWRKPLPRLSLHIPPPSMRETWNPVRPKSGRNLIIVIDPGHGGKDSGAIGPDGTYEKNVVLAIGRRLANRINAQSGMRAVLTRSTDVFIPLRQRVKKARQAHGDMFISIHADAALNSKAKGSSVFILSERGASSAAARAVADRENAFDKELTSVLVDITLAAAMEASNKAAHNVLERLFEVGDVHKESVQYAGFAVLKAPDIPSMLVETAYISNPEEEEKLTQPFYQERLAEAILGGVNEYFRNSSPIGTGTKLAEVAK